MDIDDLIKYVIFGFFFVLPILQWIMKKEILKANFDSCMEDMQQKLSEHENQSRSLQNYLQG